MNEYDIIDCVDRWAYDPILGPATRTLRNLLRAVNSNSDGWAYWQAPRTASKMLQALVAEPPASRQAQREAYKRSLTQVKRFRTKHGLHFEIEEI